MQLSSETLLSNMTKLEGALDGQMHSLVPTRVLIKKEGLYLISIKEYDSKARLCSCKDLAKRKVVFETVKTLYTVIQRTLLYIRGRFQASRIRHL